MNAIFVIATNTFVATVMASSVSLLTPQQKKEDFFQLVAFIRENYAPIDLKKKTYGVDLNELTLKYMPQIESSKTDAEFEYLVNQFAAEFHDGHLKLSAPTSLKRTLGFTVDLIEDKVLVDYLDSQYMGPNTYGIERGDELISLNNKSVQDVMTDLKKYRGRENPHEADRIAAFALTSRNGAFVPLPSGFAEIEIRKRDSGKTFLTRWPWRDVANDVTRRYERSTGACSGTSLMSPPADASIISTKPFQSWIEPSPRGNIGFLRIGHYLPERFEKMDPALWLEAYHDVLEKMQREAVGLVIDQGHNCGGDEKFLYKIYSMLINSTVHNPSRYQLRAAPITLKMEEKVLADEIDDQGDPVRMASMENTIAVLKDSIIRGLTLTPLLVSDDTPEFAPDPTANFTKPISVIIDEMAGSCGDLFPAIFQDLRRGLIVGSRTAGLGGGDIDWEKVELKYSHISMELINRMITYRLDGTPLEDNGVTPDIPYLPTFDDFMYGYKGLHKAAISSVLNQL